MHLTRAEVGGGRNLDYLTQSKERRRGRGLAVEKVRDIARFSGVVGPEAHSRVINSFLVRALYLMMS